MINYIIISVGAALGGAARYWLSNFVYRFLPTSFPYGTFIVNLTGSFLLGLLVFLFDERELLNTQLKIFLTIGFCGGFTTFSTFSLETFYLIKGSEYFLAIANILINVFLCLAGIIFAYIISKII